jgi:hypothetical protein
MKPFSYLERHYEEHSHDSLNFLTAYLPFASQIQESYDKKVANRTKEMSRERERERRKEFKLSVQERYQWSCHHWSHSWT